MVQGLSSQHFEKACDVLYEHLAQSFFERSTRFVTGDQERTAVSAYLEKPEDENEATR